MSLKIRLRRQGRTNRAAFRLVVMDSKTPRDGKYLENLGWYLPGQQENNAQVKVERINFWLSQGAELSENAANLLGKAAPELLKQLKAKQHEKRVKAIAKKRVKKSAKPAQEKAAAPKAASKKAAAPKKAAAKPRKKATKPAAEEVKA